MSHAQFIYICFKNSKKPISFHDAIVQGKILINFLNIYLGFELLHIIDDDQFMKKLNWFCENKIPFDWNYWMTLHATWIQYNSNWTKFNSTRFKFNWREMGCKMVEKVLKFYLWIWCWKFLFTKTNPKRHSSMPLYLKMG